MVFLLLDFLAPSHGAFGSMTWLTWKFCVDDTWTSDKNGQL